MYIQPQFRQPSSYLKVSVFVFFICFASIISFYNEHHLSLPKFTKVSKICVFIYDFASYTDKNKKMKLIACLTAMISFSQGCDPSSDEMRACRRECYEDYIECRNEKLASIHDCRKDKFVHQLFHDKTSVTKNVIKFQR